MATLAFASALPCPCPHTDAPSLRMHRFAKGLNSSAPMKELRRKANESDPEQALWKRLSKKPLGEIVVQYVSKEGRKGGGQDRGRACGE